MSKDVFIFIEQRDGFIQKVSYELLGKGRFLADTLQQELVAVLLAEQTEALAPSLITAGADKVVCVSHTLLQEYATEPYAKALSAVIHHYAPEIMLFGATSIGRDLAPRVSARVHTGLTADCTGLEIEETSQNLLMTRPAFGGNIMATIACENHRPQMATVRPGVMKALEADLNRRGVIEDFEVPLAPQDMNIEILEVLKEKKTCADITDAKYLISGGRGVGSPEGFCALSDLATVLGGEVSASRGAVDAGWQPHDKQVGQTGKTVRPDLYFACGISGAIQHVAGMESAEFIIAIDRNDTAPIFDVADVGIVGDVSSLLPKVTEAIKKYKEGN